MVMMWVQSSWCGVLDAGADGAVVESEAVDQRFAEEDGAGATIAFGADDFGAGEVEVFPQESGEGVGRRALATDFVRVGR